MYYYIQLPHSVSSKRGGLLFSSKLTRKTNIKNSYSSVKDLRVEKKITKTFRVYSYFTENIISPSIWINTFRNSYGGVLHRTLYRTSSFHDLPVRNHSFKRVLYSFVNNLLLMYVTYQDTSKCVQGTVNESVVGSVHQRQ